RPASLAGSLPERERMCSAKDAWPSSTRKATRARQTCLKRPSVVKCLARSPRFGLTRPMPTEYLRSSSRPPAKRDLRERAARAEPTSRLVTIPAVRVSIRARLLATPTADRIWRALPIFSTAELWGQGEVLFERHLESGCERSARVIV